MNDERKRSVALAMLSFTAGSMDAIAFLALGEVFTSAMSGNTILLGVALGQGNMGAAAHSLAAFAGYIAGVAIAALTLRSDGSGVQPTLLLEMLLLAVFAGLWTAFGGPESQFEIYPLIIVSAIAMGLQGAVGRAIRIAGIPTVVITSTLTAVVGTFAERFLARERPLLTESAREQAGAFLVYLASAVITGLALWLWADGAPFAPLAASLLLSLGLGLRWLRL